MCFIYNVLYCMYITYRVYIYLSKLYKIEYVKNEILLENQMEFKLTVLILKTN